MDSLTHFKQLNEVSKLSQANPEQAYEMMFDIEPMDEYEFIYEAIGSYVRQQYEQHMEFVTKDKEIW